MSLLALVAVLACGDKEPADSGVEADADADADADTDTDSDADADSDTDTDADSDADADSDTDADSDADADTDADADADTDTDADTDPGSESCAPKDLLWKAETRDSTGAATTSFTTSDDVYAAGVVENPCTVDVSFTTPNSCLTTGGSLSGTSGIGMGWAKACSGAATPWTVPAGSSIEESESIGRFDADTYSLSISFNRGSITGTTSFTVK